MEPPQEQQQVHDLSLCLLRFSQLYSRCYGEFHHSAGVSDNDLMVPQVIDYYVVHKGHYRVRDLYHAGKDGWYTYKFGFNFRQELVSLCSGT